MVVVHDVVHFETLAMLEHEVYDSITVMKGPPGCIVK